MGLSCETAHPLIKKIEAAIKTGNFDLVGIDVEK
jgi:hypothetical protein